MAVKVTITHFNDVLSFDFGKTTAKDTMESINNVLRGDSGGSITLLGQGPNNDIIRMIPHGILNNSTIEIEEYQSVEEVPTNETVIH